MQVQDTYELKEHSYVNISFQKFIERAIKLEFQSPVQKNYLWLANIIRFYLVISVIFILIFNDALSLFFNHIDFYKGKLN